MLPSQPRHQQLSIDLYLERRQRLERDLERQSQLLQRQHTTDGVSLFVAVNQHKELCLSHWDLWQLDYSGGRELAELARDFALVIQTLGDWQAKNRQLRQQLQLEFPNKSVALDSSVFDFNDPYDYRIAIQLLSVALVLRDAASVRQLIQLLDSNRELDALYELLISAYLDDVSEFDDSIQPDPPYELLVELFFDATPEHCQATLLEYLGSLTDVWAWEAAAVSYLTDLTLALPVAANFPQDLLTYGQQLRAQQQWTSSDSL